MAPPDATFQRASRGRRTRAKARHGSFSTEAPVLLPPFPSSLLLPPASLRHLKLPRTYHGATPPITASSRAPPQSPLSCQAREREPGRQHHINGLIARLSHVQYCWRRRLSSALLLDTHTRSTLACSVWHLMCAGRCRAILTKYLRSQIQVQLHWDAQCCAHRQRPRRLYDLTRDC